MTSTTVRLWRHRRSGALLISFFFAILSSVTSPALPLSAIVPLSLTSQSGISGAAAQLTQAPPASIVGTTTTQDGTVLLPGVLVTLIDPATGAGVADTSSDESGSFSFSGVAQGLYQVRGSLEGFREATSAPLQVRAGQQTPATLNLPVAFTDRVTVTAEPTNLAATTALPAESVRVEDIRMFEPVSTQGDIQNVLALMPGAVQGPGGGPVAINGGRPTQTRVLLDGMSIVDPITGRADIDLPSDAIDAVQILPDPSGGEYGRLSAGVIQFRTRQAPTKLTFTMSNFVPEPLFRQDTVNGAEGVHGVRDFAPQLFVGGPLIKDRVFIAESLLFEYYIPRVYGVPETAANETTRTKLDSLTRVDAVLSPTHFATFTVDIGPRKIDQVGVGLFVAPSATPSESVNSYYVSGAERATIGRAATVESTVAARDFSTSVSGAGDAPMTISPEEGRTGNFFNTQHRDFQTLQWKETLTASASNWTGTHVFKVGSDVLYGAYTGTDVSRPTELQRLDGTLAETIAFAGLSSQNASGTDGAIFAGDAWTLVPRVKIEPSLRFERDTMIGETNVAPRASLTVGLNGSGSAVLHAGLGRFDERTPLLARSFTSFEPVVITRYADNGTGQAGAPVTWIPAVAPELHDASSFIWNVGYDHRLSPHLQISANVLERRGSHDLIVEPVADSTGNTLLLDSAGQSQYKELSLWAEFTHGRVRTSASYVWSNAIGDLNSLDSFYGTFRNPIIRPNEYRSTDLDVPHRFVAWSSVPGPWGLTFSDVIEYRTGFPYSGVDAYQQYVGAANSLRFPNVFTVDLNVFHEVKIGSHVVRLIVRTYDLFNRFNPLEVQNNVTAPDFATFYSHVERRLALDFDLIR